MESFHNKSVVSSVGFEDVPQLMTVQVVGSDEYQGRQVRYERSSDPIQVPACLRDCCNSQGLRHTCLGTLGYLGA